AGSMEFTLALLLPSSQPAGRECGTTARSVQPLESLLVERRDWNICHYSSRGQAYDTVGVLAGKVHLMQAAQHAYSLGTRDAAEQLEHACARVRIEAREGRGGPEAAR